MKKTVILFLWTILMPIASYAQFDRTLSLKFDESNFQIEEFEGISYIQSKGLTTVFESDTISPALPYVCLNVLIGPNENYMSFTSTQTKVLLREGISIVSNPIETSKSQRNKDSQYVYPFSNTDNVFPNIQMKYTGTHFSEGYKYLTFLVCPFQYDCHDKKLYMFKQIDLKLILKSQSRETSVYRNQSCEYSMPVRGFFVNEVQKQQLYANMHRSNSSLEDNPYRYLIVTTDSLKNEFMRLAHWKTIKGVRADVLTVEEIYSHDTNGNRSNQLKIKYAIKDYYGPYQSRLKYVLLGGDVNQVPTEMCHIECPTEGSDLTPSDLFYSSFTNMDWDNNHNGRSAELNDYVDISPDIIVTRLPAKTIEESRDMVDRIISFEKECCMDNWNNNMLLCGVETYSHITEDGRMKSDSEIQTDTLFSQDIAQNWNGNVFRFYDTYTDNALGENYDVSKDNLQSELGKGYSFVFVNTHGGTGSWETETIPFYQSGDASLLQNPHYSFFSTAACNTNAFDLSVPCLGETFMQNKNANTMAYYGCSRKSIGSSYIKVLGIDMKFLGSFYRKLFSNPLNSLGEAVYNSKKDFLAACNGNNSTRWMYFSLNLLGDPETPIYSDIPGFIPNVSITYDGSNIEISHGTERPLLCLMSKYDEGNSFYYSYNILGDMSFENKTDEYFLCLSKNRYLPTLAIIGNTVHLQNEVLTGRNTVIANSVLIGSNVTNLAPIGPTTIERGVTVVKSHNDVIITKDFEVKKGAEFNVTISNNNTTNL